MNILFYISSLRCGGAERVATTLIREWILAGHHVTLVTSAPADTDYFDIPSEVVRVTLDPRFGVASLPVKIIRNLRRIIELRKAIRMAAPSTIVSFMDGNNVIAILASMGTRIPVVISERSDPTRAGIPKAWMFLRRLTYHWAALLVVQSTTQKNWASNNFPNLTSIVIPNPLGVDPNRKVSEHVADNREAFDLRPQHVLIVGRLVPEKQIDKLIGIFERFADAHEDWKLQIVGEGNERPKLEQLISDSRHANRIILAGATKDPSNYYANAKIYVMCSQFEGFPNAVIEAMAFGVVPIGFNCAGCLSDIVQQEHSGFIIRPDDWDALLEFMSELARDSKLAVQMSHASRERGGSFAPAVISTHWLQAIESIGKAK